MTCREVQALLTPYVLDELERPIELQVRAHLEECEDCRSESEHMRRDVGRISRAIRTELLAPEGLLDRVEQGIRRPATRAGAQRWTWMAAAASFVGLAVLSHTLWQGHLAEGRVQSMLLSYAAQPTAAMPPEEQSAIRSLSSSLGFTVETPILGRLGARLVAAGEAEFNGVRAARLQYVQDSMDCTVYVVPHEKLRFDPKDLVSVDGQTYSLRHENGVSLVAFRRGDCCCVMVARMPADQLLAMARRARALPA